MPGSEKRNELKVGLFLLTGLILLAGLIVQFGRFGERFNGHYFVTVVFDDASGVINGSEVRMGGARIGRVAGLPELNDAVQVEVKLSISKAIRIPEGSTFQINSATLLGDKLIVVVPPDERTGKFIAPGGRYMGGGPSGLEALQTNAENVSKDVLRILKEAEVTLGKVDGAVDDIKTASTQLSEAVGKINRSILADQNLANFDTSLKNFAATTEQWKATSSKLDPTLQEAREAIQAVQKAAASVEKTMKSTEQTIAEVKPAFSRLPKAVDDFASTARKAGDALDRMKRGEGVFGALSSDNDVALDAKAFMRNLRQYGIFRYRDGVSKAEQKPEEQSKPRIGPAHH